MAGFDLLIQGGTLVDGSGAAARPGSIGIRGGRIAAVGDVRGEAARTIDARGAVVAPGFIDIHTHYDAQIFWDREAHAVLVARRHDGGDGELRLRGGADATPSPRSDPAHAGERRGHVAGRAPRRRRRGLALRDLPGVSRRHRSARHDAQRGRAARAHAAAHLRDGRGGGGSRGHARRGRGDAAHRRRGARSRSHRLRFVQGGPARRVRRPSRPEPDRLDRRDPHPRGRAEGLLARGHAGHLRPGPHPGGVRAHLPGDRPAGHLDGAPGGSDASGDGARPAQEARGDAGRGHPRLPAGGLPARHDRVPVQGALPAAEHERDDADQPGRLRRPQGPLRGSRLPGSPAQQDRFEPHARPLPPDGDLGLRSRSGPARAQRGRRRRRARRASGGSGARPLPGDRTRGALPDGGGEQRRSLGRRAAGPSGDDARSVRRRRTRQPALRRGRAHHSAGQVGAREAHDLPRGGCAPADLPARRGVRDQRPGQAHAGSGRRRDDLRSRDRRLRAGAARLRLPGRRGSAGGGRHRDPHRDRERDRGARGGRRCRRRRAPPCPAACCAADGHGDGRAEKKRDDRSPIHDRARLRSRRAARQVSLRARQATPRRRQRAVRRGIDGEFSHYVDDPYVEPVHPRAGRRRGRGRDHRRRLRRPADGRASARGRLPGHPHDRAGRRRRRHLVLEPLPGRAVRRRVVRATCRCSRSSATSRSTSTRSLPRSSSTASAIARHYDLYDNACFQTAGHRAALGRAAARAGSSAPIAATA